MKRKMPKIASNAQSQFKRRRMHEINQKECYQDTAILR